LETDREYTPGVSFRLLLAALAVLAGCSAHGKRPASQAQNSYGTEYVLFFELARSDVADAAGRILTTNGIEYGRNGGHGTVGWSASCEDAQRARCLLRADPITRPHVVERRGR